MEMLEKKGAKQLLKQVSETAEDLALRPYEVMEALAEPHPIISLDGMYYRLQALILRFTFSFGGILLPVLGLLTLINLVKSVPSNWDKIKKWGKVLGLLVLPGGILAAGAYAAYNALKRDDQSVVYDDELTGEDVAELLESTILAVIPAPIRSLAAKLQSMTTGAATTSSLSLLGGATPSVMTTAAPATTQPNWLTLASAGMGILGNVIGNAVADQESTIVYDNQLPIAAAEAIAAAATDLGIDEEELATLASQKLAIALGRAPSSEVELGQDA